MEQIVLRSAEQPSHVLQLTRRIREEARVIQRCHLPDTRQHSSSAKSRAALHYRLEYKHILYICELEPSEIIKSVCDLSLIANYFV